MEIIIFFFLSRSLFNFYSRRRFADFCGGIKCATLWNVRHLWEHAAPMNYLAKYSRYRDTCMCRRTRIFYIFPLYYIGEWEMRKKCIYENYQDSRRVWRAAREGWQKNQFGAFFVYYTHNCIYISAFERKTAKKTFQTRAGVCDRVYTTRTFNSLDIARDDLLSRVQKKRHAAERGKHLCKANFIRRRVCKK